MKRIRMLRKTSNFFTGLLLLLFSFSHAVPNPSRLDFYDAFENHLMYVEFKYDATGVNTGRTVYMADGTFIREVQINYNANGERANEVSRDFNNDTSFVTSYAHNGSVSKFGIVDQFKLDFVGGNVSYTNEPGQLNFTLQYENSGAQAAVMNYTKNAEGALDRVTILEPISNDQYIGLFTYNNISVSEPVSRSGLKQTVALARRGASMLDLRINLKNGGNVRCDLMTLSGRRVQQLFADKLQAGYHSKHFRVSGATTGAISNGVYLVIVSVDGVNILQERYLHQRAVASVGGVR